MTVAQQTSMADDFLQNLQRTTVFTIASGNLCQVQGFQEDRCSGLDVVPSYVLC